MSAGRDDAGGFHREDEAFESESGANAGRGGTAEFFDESVVAAAADDALAGAWHVEQEGVRLTHARGADDDVLMAEGKAQPVSTSPSTSGT